jgi:hypothetical protein
VRRSELLLWVVSVAIAMALFAVVRGERRVTAVFTVPVSAALPGGAGEPTSLPDEVSVAISGPWARLRVLDAAALGPAHVEVARTARGFLVWHVRPEALHVPPGTRVESITPSQGAVDLRRDAR